MESVNNASKQVNINSEWASLLNAEFDKPYFKNIITTLRAEKKQFKIFPPGPEIFAAFEHTPVSKLKVVLIGQDPYHGEGQANGLCFSVKKGVRIPPSLQNIYKELKDDLGFAIPNHGDLTPWATQGVLMLNATLTVRAGEAGSHQKIGWETFTDAVISKISQSCNGIVFLLWGRFAHSKADLIDANRHYILQAAHPSPLARGAFFGSKHFSKTNELLLKQNLTPIDWAIK